MFIRENWYQRYLSDQTLYIDASFKENVLYALMILSIFGFDIKLVDAVSASQKIPKEKILESLHNPKDVRKVQEAIQKKDYNPMVDQMYQEAKKDAEKIKEKTTKKYQFNPNIDHLIQSILAVEGSGKTDISNKGAVGKMQVMPPTWEFMNRKYFNNKYPFEKYKFNENINLLMGKKYIEYLIQWLNSNQEKWQADPYLLLFTSYNAGPTKVSNLRFNDATIKHKLPGAYDYAMRAKNIMGSL